MIAILKALPWRAMAITTVAAASFSAGVLVTDWKHDSNALQAEQTRQHAEQLSRELVSEIAGITAEAIGGIRVENRTIYQATRTEILREPVYSECLVPATGVQLLTQARADGADRSSADATVRTDPPDTDQARRSD